MVKLIATDFLQLLEFCLFPSAYSLHPKYLIYDPTVLQGRGNPQLEPLCPIEPAALQKPKTAHLASRWILFNLGFLYVFFVSKPLIPLELFIKTT